MTTDALRQANRCVACGLCVPLCPTYRKLESEADSPRGRVMLARALLEGTLPPEPGLAAHLDRCLVCRACEAACPSGVRYGEIVDAARARLAGAAGPLGYRRRWVAALLAARVPLGLAARLGFRAHYPARAPRRGAVALFLGCVTRLMDGATLRATIFVLTRLGYEVHVPRGQGCCGAMHQHGGDPARAASLARRNVRVFQSQPPGQGASAGNEAMPILFAATGCGASLVEYGRHGEAGAAFARRARDVVSFLAGAEGWEAVTLAALAETVAVHEPCTARNVLRNAGDVYRLLERIPGLRGVPLAGNDPCCGSAGLYFLEQPTLARALRADTMRAVDRAGVRRVVSTNYGCARWLAQGLRAQGSDVEVLHPVVLLARQMGFTGTC